MKSLEVILVITHFSRSAWAFIRTGWYGGDHFLDQLALTTCSSTRIFKSGSNHSWGFWSWSTSFEYNAEYAHDLGCTAGQAMGRYDLGQDKRGFHERMQWFYSVCLFTFDIWKRYFDFNIPFNCFLLFSLTHSLLNHHIQLFCHFGA